MLSLIFAVLWFEQSLLMRYLLLGEACLERRVQVPSDLLYIRLPIQISSPLFLVHEGKINFVQASRMDLLSKSPFHFCSWNCQSKDGYQLLSYLHKFV